MSYAELHAKTNFSFLEGASYPDELVQRAAELGYAALAITDRNSLAGVVRAHVAAKDSGLKLLVGAEITPDDALPVVLLPTDRAAYGRLASLITRGRRRAEKGECCLRFTDVAEFSQGLLACVVAGRGARGQGVGVQGSGFRVQVEDCKLQIANCKYQIAETGARGPGRATLNPEPRTLNPNPQPLTPRLRQYRDVFGDRCYLLGELHQGPEDARDLDDLLAFSREAGVPLVAAGDVHYHAAERQALHDVLTATRLGCTVVEAREHLFPNAQRYLKPPEAMASLFARAPEAARRTLEVADRVRFSLDELRYEYPEEFAPPEKGTEKGTGRTPMEYLARLAWAGAKERYPGGVPPKVRQLIEHELALIGELRYEAYFLTVWDLVCFARRRGILCQGRGSAANSAVCYCLGITSVDPERMDVLFERFVSRERNEAPDIDVDFEHQRREEVIQYLYEKYGRDRAGMTAEVITYRPRSAVRDVGKALGLAPDCVDRLAKSIEHFHGEEIRDREPGIRGADSESSIPSTQSPIPNPLSCRCREVGIDPEGVVGRQLIELVGQLVGFPRHLSQHTGGMVMTRGKLCELVPIENAAMPDRTVIQWNKDDLDELGILKVDCLALGMLSAIHRCFDLIAEHYGAEKGSGVGGQGLGFRAQSSGFRVQSSGFRVQSSGFRKETASSESQNAEAATQKPDVPPLVPDLQPPTSELQSPNSDLRSPTPAPPPPAPLPLTLANIPADDPEVYAMIRRADTMGVFQIESRAQMSMLPRLKPRCFYDLVIEVAIVRPGPIQGDMVHPYLRRRNGEEPVTYPSAAIREVLEKTLGVPLFQEQAMRLAVVAAGFTPGEADQLRRAMGAWRRPGVIDQFRKKLLEGMRSSGLTPEYAYAVFRQIRGFGEYGFPESHAASFALLVYVSAWLKCHYPAAFTAALLNSQPMGFYAPAQLVRNAREHGVEVRSVDVNFSRWDCTLEENDECRTMNDESRRAPCVLHHSSFITHHSSFITHPSSVALRLGFRMAAGFSEVHARRIEETRDAGPFRSVEDFARRTRLGRAVIVRLAKAGAFESLGLERRRALWDALAQGPKEERLPLFDRKDNCKLQISNCKYQIESELQELRAGGKPRKLVTREKERTAIAHPSRPSSTNLQFDICNSQFDIPPSPQEVPLPPMSPAQEVLADYRTTGLSLRAHPMSFLRKGLEEAGVVPAVRLATWPNGKPVRVAGIVLVRQRPGTAKGITFVTLEDETGTANLILRPDVWKKFCAPALGATVLLAHGRLQREGLVIHVLASRLEDLSGRMEELNSQSRDFH